MIKILGIFDIIASLLFFFTIFFTIPKILLYIVGIYLLIKGAIFLISADIASILDVLSGIVILTATIFSIPKIIIAIVSVFLIQKGIFSLF